MSYRYSVILGNLGNTKDRFCGGYKRQPDTLTMLRDAAANPHVDGIELVGTWDVTPDNADDMRLALDDVGKQCVSIIPDLFTHPRFGKGSYSSPDIETRRHSIDYSLRMAEVAARLDCGLLNIWPGQDGFDYLLATDYQQQRDWFVEGIREVAEAFPNLRVALEYKPKEPRCFSTLARMADTLLACAEVGLPNVGVCIDTGHSYVAGESVGEAIVLAERSGRFAGLDNKSGRLFHMHFNDNHGLWDDDMIAGTLHHTTYIETFYWLDRCGYDGWISMDQYPYRENAADAIGESIAWLRHYDALVDTHRSEIDQAVAARDGVSTSRVLRAMMLGN